MDPFDNPPDRPEVSGQAALPDAASDDATVDSHVEDARLEKIATIKRALADGTYHVSAEELARKLIEHMLEPKE